MSETRDYDLIVIGAGAVGENVADRAVQGGLTHRDRRDRARRRRVLLLGLHAVEGAAAQRRRCCGPRSGSAARGRR